MIVQIEEDRWSPPLAKQAPLRDFWQSALPQSLEPSPHRARAARLAGLKQHINRDLLDPALSAGQLSRIFGVSDRYIRQLFAEDGTSFSDYLAERRLAHVHDRLCDRRQALRRIADIIFEAGFTELRRSIGNVCQR